MAAKLSREGAGDLPGLRWDPLPPLTRKMCILLALAICEKILQNLQPLGDPVSTTPAPGHNDNFAITRRLL